MAEGENLALFEDSNFDVLEFHSCQLGFHEGIFTASINEMMYFSVPGVLPSTALLPFFII